MRSDWKEVQLGDVSQIRRGSSPRPIIDFMANDGMPWVKIADATDNNSRFIDSTKEFIKKEGVPRSVIVEKGDLILSNSGTAGLPKFMGLTACVHDGWQVFKELDGIEKEFLYYTLINIRPKLLFNAYDSTMKNLTLDMVREAKINLPPLPTQKQIAHILSTLDDKIELNRKMNQTLEEMAQALFKSWFVDFDPVHLKAKCTSEEELEAGAKELGLSKEVLELFPSEFVESEMGMIPLGWEVQNIQDVISVKDGTHDSPKSKEVGYPLVTSKHIKNGEIELDTPKLISKEDFDKVNKRSKVEQYDILIGMIGTIGDLYLVSDNEIKYAIKNIGLFKTSEVEELSEYIYYWLDTPLMRNYIISRLAGTTQKYISLTELRKLPVVLPANDITAKFRELVGSILSMKKLNFDNLKVLMKTRDTLLPKLLSGELDVSNITLEKEN